MNIFDTISSIAWVTEFLVLMASDCPEQWWKKSGNAVCAGAVADFVAAVSSIPFTWDLLSVLAYFFPYLNEAEKQKSLFQGAMRVFESRGFFH